MDKLSPNFINEFLRLCFLKKDIYEICKQYVKYEYFPSELQSHKKILKSIINNPFESLPSMGVVSQQHSNDLDVQETLTKIRESKIVDKEVIIDELENFIKNQRFKILNDRVVDLYQSKKDDRREEAMKLQAEESTSIINFTLKRKSSGFIKVFSDFRTQVKERQLETERSDDTHEKIPFGIDKIDEITGGGIDAGDTALWILRSGVGKSTALRWTGMNACKLNYNVLHIQLEGTKQEVFDKYTQMWTKAKYPDVKRGNFTHQELESFEKYIKKMNNVDKELYIYAFEKFGDASMVDVRDLIIDYQRVRGYFPDLVIIDSLDLLKTGMNKKIDNDPEYKKEKMDEVAKLMKDVCVEFYPMRILTATQAADFNGWDDPDKVLTRSNTEGNRTLVKPFSFCYTFNATLEEMKANVGRIFIDKFRNYKITQPIVKIKTAYDDGKFYDMIKTREMYKKSEDL